MDILSIIAVKDAIPLLLLLLLLIVVMVPLSNDLDLPFKVAVPMILHLQDMHNVKLAMISPMLHVKSL
jgi:hypothetical protein